MGQKNGKEDSSVENHRLPALIKGIKWDPVKSVWHLNLKCVLMGSQGVGKTTLLSRLTDSIFDPEVEATVGLVIL